MDRINFELQHEVLTKLQAAHPNSLLAEDIGMDNEDPTWTSNAMYLHEHGLIEAEAGTFVTGEPMCVHTARLTKRGIDFLRADGGLTAFFSTVTIRFDPEMLRSMLAEKVDASDLPQNEKSVLKKHLQEAGADLLKQATTRLLDAGLDQAPALFQLLRNMLG